MSAAMLSLGERVCKEPSSGLKSQPDVVTSGTRKP